MFDLGKEAGEVMISEDVRTLNLDMLAQALGAEKFKPITSIDAKLLTGCRHERVYGNFKGGAERS